MKGNKARKSGVMKGLLLLGIILGLVNPLEGQTVYAEESALPVLMKQGYKMEGDTFQVSDVLGSEYDPASVHNITFLNSLADMPSGAWDVSEKQDGSVMAWVTGENSSYELYIAGNGSSIKAPSDCSYLFSYPNVVSIEFNGCFSTENVTDMSNMFCDCQTLKELDLSGFDTSAVTDMDDMFYGCSSLEKVELSSFDTSQVTDMGGMFLDCGSLKELDVSGFDTSNVVETLAMFSGCSSLTELDVSGFDTSKAVNMNSMFRSCSSLTELDVSGFDTSSAEGMFYMFYDCSSLTELDVSGFDTSKVEELVGTFYGCSSLTELNVSGFDTSHAENINSMFRDCSSLTELDVSGFDTSNVANMNHVFCGCSSLTELDVSNFDTSNVTYMDYMFYDCSSLTELDVSGFDTSQVTEMAGMFKDCSSLITLDVNSFDLTKAENLSDMFDGCSSLKELDLSAWDMSKISRLTDIDDMFDGCTALETLELPDSAPGQDPVLAVIRDLGYEYIGWEEFEGTYRSGQEGDANIGLDADPPLGVAACAIDDLDGDGEDELLLVLLEETGRIYDSSGKKDSRLAFIVCENENGTWVESQSISTVSLYGTGEEDSIATIADIIPDIRISLAPYEDGKHILISNNCEYVFADSAEDIVREKTEIIYTGESISGMKCTAQDEDEFKRMTWLMDDHDSVLISQIYASFFQGNTATYDQKIERYELFLSGTDDSVDILLKDFGEFADEGERLYEENGWVRPDYVASDYLTLPVYTGLSVPDVEVPEVTETFIGLAVSELFTERGWEYSGLDSVTDEQAAILSYQKYQTSEEFMNAVWRYYNSLFDYTRSIGIFGESIMPVITANAELLSLPQDVLEYDLTSLVAIGDHPAGESVSSIYSMLGEDIFESYEENLARSLLEEMIIKCIAEEQGITDISEEAYWTLMYSNGCDSKEDLRNCYSSEREMNQELLLLDIAEAVVKQSNVDGTDSAAQAPEETDTAYGGQSEAEEERTEENGTSDQSEEIQEDISDSESGIPNQGEEEIQGGVSESEDNSGGETSETDYGMWVTDYVFDNGDCFNGFVKDGACAIWGTVQLSSGDFYEGQFEGGSFNGYGIYTTSDGLIYEGEFNQNEMDGLAVVYFPDGGFFLGEFEDGLLNGYGALCLGGGGEIAVFGLFENNELVQDGEQDCIVSSDGAKAFGFTVDENHELVGKGIEILPDNSVFIGETDEDTGSRYAIALWSNGDLEIGLHDSNGDLQDGFYDFTGTESESVDYLIGSFQDSLMTDGFLKFNDGSWRIGRFEDGAYQVGSGFRSEDVY